MWGRHVLFLNQNKHIYRLLCSCTVSEKLLKIPLFGPLIHQLGLLGSQQHPQSGVLLTSFSTWGTENGLTDKSGQYWGGGGVIKGWKIFLGQKLANVALWVGTFLCNMKKSREQNTVGRTCWTPFRSHSITPLYNSAYCFCLWYKFFVHNALRVKKLSTWAWCGTFVISVSLAEGMSHLVALFRGLRQNTRSHLLS